jgi:hypothetical protein
MTSMNFAEYLSYVDNKWAQGWIQRDKSKEAAIPLSFDYMDIVDGNPYDAMLLARIIWWHGINTKKLQPRLHHRYKGHLWIVKTHDEWAKEMHFKSSRTVAESLRRLADLGIIISERHKSPYHKGQVVSFVRINWNIFAEKMTAIQGSGSTKNASPELTESVEPETTENVSPETTNSVVPLPYTTTDSVHDSLSLKESANADHAAPSFEASLLNESVEPSHTLSVNPTEAGRDEEPLTPSSAPPPSPVTQVTPDTPPTFKELQSALIEAMIDVGKWRRDSMPKQPSADSAPTGKRAGKKPKSPYHGPAGKVANLLLALEVPVRPEECLSLIQYFKSSVEKRGRHDWHILWINETTVSDWRNFQTGKNQQSKPSEQPAQPAIKITESLDSAMSRWEARNS